MNPQSLTAFVERAAKLAGLDGEVDSFGVSRIWRASVDGRRVEIGTNGSYYWVATDLRPTSIPDGVVVASAPEGSYARAKYLDECHPHPPTGDVEFDSLFVIMGGPEHAIARWPDAAARRAFIEAADVHPSLERLDTVQLAPRLHLRAAPSMHRGAPGQWHALGTGPFTPEHAADAARRLLALAVRLEA